MISSPNGTTANINKGRESHHRRRQFKDRVLGRGRHGIFFNHHLDRIGNGLQQPELSGAVGAVANLQPGNELSFHQHQISSHQQQAYHNYQQFDQ